MKILKTLSIGVAVAALASTTAFAGNYGNHNKAEVVIKVESFGVAAKVGYHGLKAEGSLAAGDAFVKATASGNSAGATFGGGYDSSASTGGSSHNSGGGFGGMNSLSGGGGGGGGGGHTNTSASASGGFGGSVCSGSAC
jgi:hypothetical protein